VKRKILNRLLKVKNDEDFAQFTVWQTNVPKNHFNLSYAFTV
jgi:hypothetical protein